MQFPDFKFELNQIVTTETSKREHAMMMSTMKAGTIEAVIANGRAPHPMTLTVIERNVCQSQNATEYKYLCRYFTGKGYERTWFNEDELTEHPTVR
jgi:uncharacterized protein YodC (DUF2158 family)